MSVSTWSPRKRLTVEIRKALNGARKAGAPTDFAALASKVPSELSNEESHETLFLEVKNRSGRRFCFSDDALYIEANGSFVRLPYESILGFEWIADTKDFSAKVAQKRSHGDRLILRDVEDARHELDALGWAFQAMYNFFGWLLHRREARESNTDTANGAQAAAEPKR